MVLSNKTPSHKLFLFQLLPQKPHPWFYAPRVATQHAGDKEQQPEGRIPDWAEVLDGFLELVLGALRRTTWRYHMNQGCWIQHVSSRRSIWSTTSSNKRDIMLFFYPPILVTINANTKFCFFYLHFCMDKDLNLIKIKNPMHLCSQFSMILRISL